MERSEARTRGPWWTRERVVALGILAAAVVLRLGTIVTPHVIDWDESTFLLMGQRLTLGELPYTTTFDSKPPLAFVLTAIPMAIAPDSLVVARVVLALVIGITAVTLARLVRSSGAGTGAAVASALLFIVLAGAVRSGITWMTEHGANLMLAPLLVTVARATPTDRRTDLRTAVVVGVWAGLVTLARANYALVAAAIVAVWLMTSPRGGRGRRLACASGGALAMLAVVVLVYAAAGELAALRAGLIDVTIAQRAGGLPDSPPPDSALALTGLQLALAGLALVGLRSDAAAAPDTVRRATASVTAATLAGLLSIVLHDNVWEHHVLTLIVPVAAQVGLTAAAWNGRDQRTGRRRVRLAAAALAVAACAATISVVAPREIVPRPQPEKWQREADVTAAVTAALAERPGTVLALEQHHVLWRLGLLPLHPLATHPFAIVNPTFWGAVPWELDRPRPRSALDAFDAMMELRPTHVITSVDKPWEWFGSDADLVRAMIGLRHRVVWTSSDGKFQLWTCDTC